VLTQDGVRVGFLRIGVYQPVFLLEKRKANMFVTVSMYRAKASEEDAVIALHEDWQRNQQAKAQGYLSGELLRNIQTPREFVAIMRFENQAGARELANDPEQNAWFRRLVSLVENVSVLTEYTCEWSTGSLLIEEFCSLCVISRCSLGCLKTRSHRPSENKQG
jgi:hypothetical protein